MLTGISRRDPLAERENITEEFGKLGDLTYVFPVDPIAF
jgi:hypothetical protein